MKALEYKPDMEDAARRWEAFHAGEILDRPVVCVTAPREGYEGPGYRRGYHDRVFGDLNEEIDRTEQQAAATFHGGEAIPTARMSFGPDEVGCFCGAELGWSDDSPDTNWAKPFITDWETQLPLKLQNDNPLWLRMLEFYRLAAERLEGKMLLSPLDLHTNMDLLMAVRGSENLCMDLIDCPELIDRAMADARAVFPEVWEATAEAGKMDENGYCHTVYSPNGAAFLQCDFSCMIGPEMFRRWVLPALEEEASIVKHVVYHWDGPDALKHADDLIASKGLHTLSYVPGTGHGGHIEFIDLFKRVQAGGKAVHVHGSPDQLKQMHKELKPELVLYCTGTGSQAEAEDLLKWFVDNT